MNLKSFKKSDISYKADGVPFLRIHLKSGVFSFNKTAAEILELKAGDQVMLHQDEDEPENWYLEQVKEDGFPLRINQKEKYASLTFNSAPMAKHMFDVVDTGGDPISCRALIAKEPTKFEKRTLWGIIMTEANFKITEEK